MFKVAWVADIRRGKLLLLLLHVLWIRELQVGMVKGPLGLGQKLRGTGLNLRGLRQIVLALDLFDFVLNH